MDMNIEPFVPAGSSATRRSVVPRLRRKRRNDIATQLKKSSFAEVPEILRTGRIQLQKDINQFRTKTEDIFRVSAFKV